MIIGARYVVPWLMYEIAKTNRRELFILSTVVICFAVAWATSSIGLSLALGAFLAGLIISETEYSYQAAGAIIPFHEIFTSFFFVSIGMLLDLSFLWAHLWVILLIGLAAVVLKALVAMIAGLALKYTLRTSLMTGLVLFQVGEFAFILARTGIDAGILANDIYQYFLAISILSMAFTPFVIQWAPAIAGRLVRTPLTGRLAILNRRFDPETEEAEDYLESLKDHVIIIGYGMTGRHLAQAARFAQIPYVILESDAAIVREERSRGEPIFYGDATSDFMLEHLKVWSARVAIVAISDPEASKMVVSNIRSICHTVHVIVRTRYLREADTFKRLGASEVVPEELETSIEIFTRLMNKYLVPQDEIGAFVQRIRADNFEVMRPATMAPPPSVIQSPLRIPDVNVTCLRVQHARNEVVGQTLAESNLRGRFGINLLAIVRDGTFITDIHADTRILQEDLIYVVGKPEAVAGFNEMIKY